MAEGISYSPVTSYDRRDGQMAQITSFVDGLEAVHARLVNGFVDTVDRLAEEPPAAREVTEIVDSLRAPIKEPGAASGWVVGAAPDELVGATRSSLEDLLAEIGSPSSPTTGSPIFSRMCARPRPITCTAPRCTSPRSATRACRTTCRGVISATTAQSCSTAPCGKPSASPE